MSDRDRPNPTQSAAAEQPVPEFQTAEGQSSPGQPSPGQPVEPATQVPATQVPATQVPATQVPATQVMVCQHDSCRRNGSAAVLAALQAAELPEGVEVVPCDCLGQCSVGPSVRVVPEETWYCRLQPEDVPRLVAEHLRDGEPLADRLHPRFHMSFY